MSADYRVELQFIDGTGTVLYSWTRNRGDAPALPEILDGLTIGWQFPESTLWPIQPEAITLSLSLLGETAAAFASLDRGIGVRLRVWAGVDLGGTEYDSITFTGKVSDLVGKPRRFGHPATGDEVNGWQVDVIAVDTTTDLAEYTVAGYYSLQGVSVIAHVGGHFDLAGVPAPAWGDGGYGTVLLASNDPIDPVDLYSDVDRLLANYADGGAISGDASIPSNHALYNAQGWRRGIIRPNSDPAGVVDPDTPYRIEWISRRYGEQPGIGPALPGVFANLGGGVYGVRLEAPPATIDVGGTPVPIYDASIVLDADYLDYDALWTRTKFNDPNTIDVANNIPVEEQSSAPWSKVTATNATPGETIVSASITDSRAYQVYDAASIAQMYLDDSANTDVVWSGSGFRWYASQDPAWPINRSLFPDTELFGEYGAPVVITGIPEHQRPDGRPWYVGVPRLVQWTFGGGDFVIDLDLYPRTPRPINSGAVGLTWAELGTDFPAVKWTDLDPAQTWIDYRLARSAIYYP